MTAVDATTSGQRDTRGGRRLRIARWRPGQARARVQEFTVTAGPHATLLDALREIRSHQDSSLTLRYSCCHSSCGTCGMRMNGREVLACVTPLADAGPGPILVEPLANARVEHDLVVDMRDLYDQLEPTGRPLVRQDTSLAVTTEETGAFARFEDCIECGLCVSACPIAGSDPLYLGPAALSAAWRSVAEPRGVDPEAVLAWADDEQGCWRCHVSFECTEACPAGVDPAGAIMALRGELGKREIRRLAGRARAMSAPRAVLSWVSLRGRHLGGAAFLASRVTGLLLVAYLYLHLGVLYLLTEGPGSWASVLRLFKNHYFLALESLLILFILVHGLNGLRIALVGNGIGVRRQKAWFTTAMGVSAAVYVVVVLAMSGVI